MHYLLNFGVTNVLNRPVRNVLQYYSLITKLQDTTLKRYNKPVFREKINYLPRIGSPRPKLCQRELLIEIYFILFLEELLESTHIVFSEGIYRIDRVLTIGMIAENLDIVMSIARKEHLADEVRSWFLNCFSYTDDERILHIL